MKLSINSQEENFLTESISLVEILRIKGVKRPEMVSVQLNGRFVRNEEFGTSELKEGDEIEFIYFMGGGYERG